MSGQEVPKPQRSEIFLESAMEMNSRCGRTGPDKAEKLGGVGRYKDFTPDGALERSATVSAGSVAAGGWAEAV